MALMRVYTPEGWVVIDLTAANLGEELLVNRDIKLSVNVRNFNGNWAMLPIGVYGYDRWLKVSDTEKGQIIPAGRFVNGKKHTLSYWLDGKREYEALTSPMFGHWLVKVPFMADYLSLRKGLGYSEYVGETDIERRRNCEEFAEYGSFNIGWQDILYSEMYNVSYQFELNSAKYRQPSVVFIPGKNRVNAAVISVNGQLIQYRITGYDGSLHGNKTAVYLADSELYLEDLEEQS